MVIQRKKNNILKKKKMYMYVYDRVENVTIIIGSSDFWLFDNVLKYQWNSFLHSKKYQFVVLNVYLNDIM